MKAGCIVLGILTVSACSTIGSVIPLGQDTYQVSVSKHGGLSNWTAIKEMSYQRATEYCGTKHKQMQEVSTKTSGVRGLTPQEAELTFRCE